jgi:CRISPR-associated endonuclease/helicase Cas3
MFMLSPRPCERSNLSAEPAEAAHPIADVSAAAVPSFEDCFAALSRGGWPPLAWQRRLYAKMCAGELPRLCALPTGLGKTSVIPLWLIALARSAPRGRVLPRRLVYVVNRRTIVDEASAEAARLASLLAGPPENTPAALAWLRGGLRDLAGSGTDGAALAVSTLRGGAIDNGAWRADPAQAAVIVGTVDMIGSRLLFAGYGDGRSRRALHAGLLGQDTLIIHDEAHLSPAFGCLLRAVQDRQERDGDPRPIHVMELSATPPPSAGLSSSGPPSLSLSPASSPLSASTAAPIFGLAPEDLVDPVVQARMNARKHLKLIECPSNLRSKLEARIVTEALALARRPRKVLVYLRSPESALAVAERLAQAGRGPVRLLTGTMRGFEREQMVRMDPVFRGFFSGSDVSLSSSASFLVATSAGEVGIDLDADDLVCDLATLENMIQRLGRVNRLGGKQSTVTVVHTPLTEPTEPDSDEARLERSRAFLAGLPRSPQGLDASPAAIHDRLVHPDDPPLDAALGTRPEIRPLTEVILDQWALTSIQGPLPGREPVHAYLHGLEDEPPSTQVAWRADVAALTAAHRQGAVSLDDLDEVLRHYPLKPWETLSDRSKRVQEQLGRLVARCQGQRQGQCQGQHQGQYEGPCTVSSEGHLSALLIDPAGLRPLQVLAIDDLASVDLAGRLVILPVEAGGLSSHGLLDPESSQAGDVADATPEPPNQPFRRRVLIEETAGGRTRRVLGAKPETIAAERRAPEPRPLEGPRARALRHRRELVLTSEGESPRRSVVYITPAGGQPRESSGRVLLEAHARATAAAATTLAKALNLDAGLRDALQAAAYWHDAGKARALWQRYACNAQSQAAPLGKSDRYADPRALCGYRHEFGSVADAAAPLGSREDADLIRHLIAVHHGWGRPQFPHPPIDPMSDPATDADERAYVIAARYGRLQQRYGRWGLAWLEALLKCADAAAQPTADTSAPVDDSPTSAAPITHPRSTRPCGGNRIEIPLELGNPGEFLACCGLFELAHRLWPGSEACFDDQRFILQAPGTLDELLRALAAAAPEPFHPERPAATPLWLGGRVGLRLDWWNDAEAGGKAIKTWAGTMKVDRIARALHAALCKLNADGALLESQSLLHDPEGAGSSVASFGFDARCSWKTGGLEAGFSADALGLMRPVFPAVDYLALIGLQRFRPVALDESRFGYTAWSRPLPIVVASPVMSDAARFTGSRRFAFSLLARSRYLKAFSFAIPRGDQ